MSTNRMIALVGAGVVGLGLVIGLGAAAPADEAKPAKATAPAAAGAEKAYAVDSVHTTAVFRVKHMQTSYFYGTFNKIEGSFNLGQALSANITVHVDSVDTNNSKRDDHAKSNDFLAAQEFPTATLVAKNFAKSGDNAYKGTAQFTFRGVTKPVELTINVTGTGKGGMKGDVDIAGIDSTFTFKRSDFGAKAMIPALSDEVTIMFASEGGAK